VFSLACEGVAGMQQSTSTAPLKLKAFLSLDVQRSRKKFSPFPLPLQAVQIAPFAEWRTVTRIFISGPWQVCTIIHFTLPSNCMHKIPYFRCAPAIHEISCTMEIMLASFDKCAGVSEWSFRKPPQFIKTPKFTKKHKKIENYKN